MLDGPPALFFWLHLSDLRGLLRPPEGHGIAYIDFSAQEIAIAAALGATIFMAKIPHVLLTATRPRDPVS